MPTLCSIDQAEKHPHGIRQWLLPAVELAFGLTNKLAFALTYDLDGFRVALPHVALPPPGTLENGSYARAPAGSANIAVAISPWSAGSPAPQMPTA